MSKAVDFIKTSGIYFAGNVLTKVLSFLLLPLYTSKLEPSAFGYYNLTINVLTVIIPFFCLEVWSAILRFMLNPEREDDRERTLLSAWIILIFGFTVFTLGYIGAKLFFDVPYIEYIFVFCIVQTLQYVYNSIARGYGENLLYASSGLICSFINLSTNVILITVFHQGIESLYTSVILGMVIQIAVIELKVKTFRRISFKLFDKGFLKEMIRFSLPLSFNTICYFFAGSYNSIVISNVLGLDSNGLYSVAGKFVTVLTLVTSCFTMSLQEMTYRSSRDANRGSFYTTTVNYYFKFITIAILAIIPAVKVVYPLFVADATYRSSRDANRGSFYTTTVNYYFKFITIAILAIIPAVKVVYPLFVADAYSGSLSVVPLYFLSTVASNYATCLGNYFMAEKQTKPLTISLLAAGITNFILIHLLIGPLGMQASNIALTISLLAAGITNFILIHLLIGPLGMQASNIALFVAFSLSCVLRLIMFKRIGELKFDYKYLAVFIVLFVGTMIVFYMTGTIVY